MHARGFFRDLLFGRVTNEQILEEALMEGVLFTRMPILFKLGFGICRREGSSAFAVCTMQ